jgi:hypothetical protein
MVFSSLVQKLTVSLKLFQTGFINILYFGGEGDSFFPPLGLFLSPNLAQKPNTVSCNMDWWLKKNRCSDFFVGYCRLKLKME